LLLFGSNVYFVDGMSVISNLKYWHLWNIWWLTNNISMEICKYILHLCTNQFLFCVSRRVRKIVKREYYPRDICLSVRTEISAPTGRIFTKFDIWIFFENLSKEIQVLLKSNENNGHFRWRPMCIDDNICALMTISLQVLLGMKKCFTQNTHFMLNNIFPKILSFVGKTWKIMVQPDRQATDDNII
jgi:hypothetical protein